jgi:DNA-binding XRE family transcriptional regulator
LIGTSPADRRLVNDVSETVTDDFQRHPVPAPETTDAIATPRSPRTRQPAYRVIREDGSRARLAYGTPRIEASYAASDGEAVPLKDVRADRGVSIVALAQRSGISVSTIHRIEHGETVPKPRVVRALSAALGIAPWQVAEFQPVVATVGLPQPTVLALRDLRSDGSV